MTSPMRLWKSGIGMAKTVALRRARSLRGVQADDLVQAALIGLWKAALVYREDGGASFVSFAWHYVRGEVNCERWRHCLLGFKGGKAEAYGKYKLPEFVGVEGDEREQISSSSFDDEDYLEVVMAKIPSRLRLVARLYWIDGCSTRRMAEVLGCGVDRVEQLRPMAFREMVKAAHSMQDIGWLKDREEVSDQLPQ